MSEHSSFASFCLKQKRHSGISECSNEMWNTELCEPTKTRENFAKVNMYCQVMKGIRRLSRNSECMCDLEKIAFVG